MSSGLTSIESQFNLNADKSNSESSYEFEDFRLDGSILMLYRDDEAVALAPKVVETLLALVERRGEIVSKEEMMKRLWADAFVEDANLTQNIYLLRKTLGKGHDGRDLIETFRRRGYRFNGKIAENSDGAENKSASGERQISSAANTEFNSLAVLPLTNESDDPNAEYLSDGITESIINRLSQISTLRVVARNTVFQYKNKAAMPQEVGRKLGVSAILTGRILFHDERLIVRVELVETVNGWQIWGEQYDRPAADVLGLQETMAREISENLHLKLSSEEQKRLTKRYTQSSEAYHLFVRGRHQLNKRLTKDIEQAAEYFQKAIDVDPTFVPAYVGLADCYPLLSLYGALTPQEAYPKARAAAEKALEIDDRFTKAYNSLGVVKLFYEWDWAGAETAFKRAIELNHGYSDARQRYGMFLTAQGRFAEAVAEFERARQFDPLSLIIQTIAGYPFYYSRRYDEAARLFAEVTATDETYSMAHFRLGLTMAQQGLYDDSIVELQKAIGLSNDRDTIAALGYVHGLQGNHGEANAALAELAEREKDGFVTSYNRVLVNIGLENYPAALDWLEKAFDERSYWLIYLKVDPALDATRDDSRFVGLQAKIFGANSKIPENAFESENIFHAAVSQINRNNNYAALLKSETNSPKNNSLKLYILTATVLGLVLLIIFFVLSRF